MANAWGLSFRLSWGVSWGTSAGDQVCWELREDEGLELREDGGVELEEVEDCSRIVVVTVGGGRTPDFPECTVWHRKQHYNQCMVRVVHEAAVRLGRKGGIASGIARRR